MDPNAFAELMQKQSEAISHRLENCPITWQASATISEALSQGPWTKSQYAMLTSSVVDGTQRAEKAALGRRPNQSCKDFTPFWSKSDITALQSAQPLQSKLDVVASRMVAW